MPYDVQFSGSNGGQTLVDAVSYRPFLLVDFTPKNGRQDSGILHPPAPQLSYEGQPPIPITFDLVTETGAITPDTTVSFGNDTIGFKTALTTSMIGETMVVELPDFLLGPQDVVVDVRIENAADSQTFPDAFTYDASDWREDTSTEHANFGSAPECLMAGEFVVGKRSLLLIRNFPKPETNFGYLFIGLDLLDPFAPVMGGFLAPTPDLVAFLPLNLVSILGFEILHKPELALVPDGTEVYAQVITQESDGVSTVFSHSSLLICTVRQE